MCPLLVSHWENRGQRRNEAASKAAINPYVEASLHEQSYPCYAAQNEGAYGSATEGLQCGQPQYHGTDSATDKLSPVVELAPWPATPIDTTLTVSNI